MNNDAMKAAEILRGFHKILVVTHQKPDGDAFGTALGLQWTLRENGYVADALLPGDLPLKYRDFADGYLKAITTEALALYDCVVTVDCARPEMLAVGDLTVDALWARPVLNIDHHPDNSIAGTWNFVMPHTAAAAEAVWQVVTAAGWHVSPKAATLFMIGLVTDTGGFRFSNSDAEAFAAGAGMLACQADFDLINTRVFFSKPLNQQLLEAELILHGLHLDADKQLAWAVVTPELLCKYDFDMRDGEGVIERLREIDGVVIAALFYPRGDGIKVSLRSQDRRYSVGQVARSNGGGGHDMAAGITCSGMNAAQAAGKIVPQLEALLGDC